MQNVEKLHTAEGAEGLEHTDVLRSQVEEPLVQLTALDLVNLVLVLGNLPEETHALPVDPGIAVVQIGRGVQVPVKILNLPVVEINGGLSVLKSLGGLAGLGLDLLVNVTHGF